MSTSPETLCGMFPQLLNQFVDCCKHEIWWRTKLFLVDSFVWYFSLTKLFHRSILYSWSPKGSFPASHASLANSSQINLYNIHTPSLCSLVCERIDPAGRVEACQVDHVKKKIQHIVVSQIARDQKGLFLLRIYGLHYFSWSCSMFVTILYFLAYIVPHEWASRVDLNSKRKKIHGLQRPSHLISCLILTAETVSAHTTLIYKCHLSYMSIAWSFFFRNKFTPT